MIQYKFFGSLLAASHLYPNIFTYSPFSPSTFYLPHLLLLLIQSTHTIRSITVDFVRFVQVYISSISFSSHAIAFSNHCSSVIANTLDILEADKGKNRRPCECKHELKSLLKKKWCCCRCHNQSLKAQHSQ